jgi:hypothetical protein
MFKVRLTQSRKEKNEVECMWQEGLREQSGYQMTFNSRAFVAKEQLKENERGRLNFCVIGKRRDSQISEIGKLERKGIFMRTGKKEPDRNNLLYTRAVPTDKGLYPPSRTWRGNSMLQKTHYLAFRDTTLGVLLQRESALPTELSWLGLSKSTWSSD